MSSTLDQDPPDNLINEVLFGEHTWNHRVVKINDMFGICEVYYNTNGDPELWTAHCEPMGETPEELLEEIKMFKKAFKAPILKQVGEDEMASLVEWDEKDERWKKFRLEDREDY